MKLKGRFNDKGWGNDLGNRALKIPRNTFREGFLMAGAISNCDRWPRKKGGVRSAIIFGGGGGKKRERTRK